jgi:hypothetical protein
MNNALQTALQRWCEGFDQRLSKLADKLHFPVSRDGFCAIASYLTYNALQPLNRYVDSPVAFKRAQPPVALGVEASHCWVEVADCCIDFAAGQFCTNTYNKLPSTSFIFEPKRCYQRRLRSWDVAKYPAKSLTLSGIRPLLKDWPMEQLPYNEAAIQRFMQKPHFKFHAKSEYQRS